MNGINNTGTDNVNCHISNEPISPDEVGFLL